MAERTTHVVDWQRSIVLLTHVVAAAVSIAALYWAQAVLVPLALALFLTLILAPLAAGLERRGLRRSLAVLLVVLLASLVVVGMAWIITSQVVPLAADLPNYQDNIKAKARSLKELATGAATGRLGKLIDEVSSELGKRSADATEPGGPTTTEAPGEAPAEVVVASDSSRWMGQAIALLSGLAESLATAALSL